MKFKANIYWGSLYQLATVFLSLWLSRFVFMAYNSTLIGLDSVTDTLKIALAGIRIDACILGYANAVFVVMRFAPWPCVCRKGWITTSNWLLGVINSLLLILNLGDTAYFPFTGYRMSWQGFLNVLSDPGTPSLLLSFLTDYWWAYLLEIIFVAAMIWAITRVKLTEPFPYAASRKRYWITRTCIFLVMGTFTFMCIRGWMFRGRPIERATGVTLVDNPRHFPAVLNTPFSILFSIGKEVTVEKLSFFSPEKLRQLRCSVVSPGDSLPNGKNLFVIVIESGGSVLSKVFNPAEGDTTYTSALQFVDSLASHSLLNMNLYASGRTSTQGITHIFEGIPWFGASYFVESPYAGDKVDSPARLLAEKGYDTRFYYACTKGNYHIDETARMSGFNSIFTRESYGDESQYDGKWGIFDMPMADFVVKDLSSSYKPGRPFFASWFTITAHMPFNLPVGTDLSDYHYKKESPEQAMEYTDKALRHFFTLARRQPWYGNTIFVITSDHGQRDLGSYHSNNVYCHNQVPFLIFTPDGSVTPAAIDSIPMSQIDIAPTLLDLVGYDRPHLSLGSSMFDTARSHYGIVDSFGSFHIIGNRYIVAVPSLKGEVSQVFDINEQPYPKTPLENYDKAEADRMLTWFRALMQDYSERLIDNRLHAGE